LIYPLKLVFYPGFKLETGWWYTYPSEKYWYTYPSEKYEFVSWDDEIPTEWKKCSKPTNQLEF